MIVIFRVQMKSGNKLESFHGEETVRDLSILACMQELQRFMIGYEDTANIKKEVILIKIMLNLFTSFIFSLSKIILTYLGLY